ncbi:glycerol-3-phosphate dehydrogenase [NAD(+)], cytoplasmic-like [Clytia hemisphaerica]|uniref:Glycerol-3-phosphate dehydrogenase [NAD(+)] n=1 Tax=Clytia hemisphaerica TaxID=252671 RepID=A0A7M5UYF5_9CNID|eukprot:TCONS_00005053-protein
MAAMRRVCLVGSGNWGSAIAKIIGNNVMKSKLFEKTVNMYVYEEMVDGQKLTDIINKRHENVKYLPGVQLPSNVVAIPSLVDACKDANVLVFVIPHQFVDRICNQLKGNLAPDAVGVSLIKGLSQSSVGIENMSDIIGQQLDINCSALMGANIAHEVADEQFCESTIGCTEETLWPMWKELFHCSYFKINCVRDVHTVELCGALKNAVAVGAGIIDALEFGDNTKAAVIRLGLIEMRLFAKHFFSGVEETTFFESCGLADLITTCYGGRNRKVAEAFVRTGKSLEELEAEMLNGQKLQGPHTAFQVYQLLKEKNIEKQFPLFTSVYRICYENEDPSHLIDTLRDHY